MLIFSFLQWMNELRNMLVLFWQKMKYRVCTVSVQSAQSMIKSRNRRPHESNTWTKCNALKTDQSERKIRWCLVSEFSILCPLSSAVLANNQTGSRWRNRQYLCKSQYDQTNLPSIQSVINTWKILACTLLNWNRHDENGQGQQLSTWMAYNITRIIVIFSMLEVLIGITIEWLN